jgi:hypothetical protein
LAKLQTEFASYRPLEILADVLADEVGPQASRATRRSSRTGERPAGKLDRSERSERQGRAFVGTAASGALF